MLRRIVICAALAGTPQFAGAQTVQEQVVSQLRGQGFTEITLQRTWLGRIRVVAVRDGLRRELVFNPQTGEILRDFWRDEVENGLNLFNPGGGSSSAGGNGSSQNGNDDDDDQSDDNSDDDQSDDDQSDDDRSDDDDSDDDRSDDDNSDDD